MGDFRVICKIELNGKKYESNLNWRPYEIHADVYDWLENTWHEESYKIMSVIDKGFKELERENDYKEYLRLKEKLGE